MLHSGYAKNHLESGDLKQRFTEEAAISLVGLLSYTTRGVECEFRKNF
jgi:hypothetical protein